MRSGRCELDVYDDGHTLVATRTFNPGDVMIMVAGEHGFRMLEDEHGPYTGCGEMVLF